jgi:chromosome partitioning protein
MIVLIGGEKGGTGKTTLATNLAAQRSAAGCKVLLVDADPQGSASNWAQLREEAGIMPEVSWVHKFGQALEAEIASLVQRYDDILIDVGGRGDSLELSTGLAVAHKAVIPLQASQFDLWTLARMDKLVSTAKKSKSLVAGVGCYRPCFAQSSCSGNAGSFIRARRLSIFGRSDDGHS